MVNAVIYARYSSHNQREESIEGQLRKCHEFAQKNNLNVIAEYCDRAITGKTDNRPQFQKMIKDAEKGHFQAVIMYTLDRFARNRYDSATYKAKLKKHGIKLYYTEQPINDDPEGIILESLLEGMAEYYSANLSRGVKRGLKENALKCLVTGGYMPLGYRKSADKTFEIDPHTAPIVKEIFDLYTSGTSQRQIVNILNEKGYRTVRGNPFKIDNIANIIKNKKYIGIYAFDDVEIENGVPAIVDRDVFDKAQTMLQRNRRAPGRMKAPEQYLLTGKLFCGHCGSIMNGESGHSQTGAIYNYYKCTERRQKTCNKKTERKDELEKAVVLGVRRHLMMPGMIEDISTMLADIVQKEFNDQSRLNSLQEELKSTKKSISNLLGFIEKGIDTDDIGDRLLELNALKNDLLKQIAFEETKKPDLTKDEFAFWLTRFITEGDPDSKDYQQDVIDTLVNKIFCYDTDDGGRKYVVTCNTTANKNFVVTLDDIKNSSYINGLGRPLGIVITHLSVDYSIFLFIMIF